MRLALLATLLLSCTTLRADPVPTPVAVTAITPEIPKHASREEVLETALACVSGKYDAPDSGIFATASTAAVAVLVHGEAHIVMIMSARTATFIQQLLDRQSAEFRVPPSEPLSLPRVFLP